MSACEHLSGLIFVLIGPGGAGKNAIMKALIAQRGELRQLATATTRQMRGDEAQGREHLFVSEVEFARMIAEGELLEHQEVTPGKFYGIPRRTVLEALTAGAVRIADIDVLGAKILARAYRENVVQIYVTVPGGEISAQLGILKERMQMRADPNTDIAERLERAKCLELPYQAECDYVVVNDELSQAIRCAGMIVERELQWRGLAGSSA